MFSLPNLEHQLNVYILGEVDPTFSKPFDISTVPVVTREQALAEDRTRKLTSATPTMQTPAASAAPAAATAATTHTANSQRYTEQLQAIPEIAAFGGVLKSSNVVELTETNNEYVVSAVKHIFKYHLVLQFDVRNTVPDIALEDVFLEVTPDDEALEAGFDYQFHIPHPLIKTDDSGVVYVAFKRPQSFVAGSFSNIVKFVQKEIDPSTNEPAESGDEDSYEIDDCALLGADYISPSFAGDFKTIHDALPDDDEHAASVTLALEGIKTLAEAVETLTKTLDMAALEGTDMVMKPTTHTLLLYGKSVGGGKVCAQVKMAQRQGVTIQVSCRSEEAGLAAVVVEGLERL